MESGAPTTVSNIKASAKEADWELFVSLVPQCAGVQPGNTFACLRSASADDLAQAIQTFYAKTNDTASFFPVVDGPGGVIPDSPVALYKQGHFAKLPFIQGNNLDEG